MDTPEIRCTLTIRGQKAERIRLLKQIIGLSTDADILQHLIQRGMSAEASTFAAWDVSRKTQEALTAQIGGMAEQMKIHLED